METKLPYSYLTWKVTYRSREVQALSYISSGLPNTFGGYDETPEVTAKHLKVGDNIYCVCISSKYRGGKYLHVNQSLYLSTQK